MLKALSLASLVAIAIGLLWSVDAAAHVEAYDETRRIDPWAERGAFQYAPQRSDGTALAMGEPGYFTSEAPRVAVAFAWTLDDPSVERVTALGSLRLLVERAASPGKLAWQHTTWIANETLAGARGETLSLAGKIDLPAIEAAIAQTPGRNAEGAQWTLIAQVKFATAPNQAHSREASEFLLPIAYTPPLYVLPSEDGATLLKDHARAEVVHHETRGGVPALLANPAGLALLFGGLAGLAYALPLLPRDEEAPA